MEIYLREDDTSSAEDHIQTDIWRSSEKSRLFLFVDGEVRHGRNENIRVRPTSDYALIGVSKEKRQRIETAQMQNGLSFPFRLRLDLCWYPELAASH
jgi:hypothetical protein